MVTITCCFMRTLRAVALTITVEFQPEQTVDLECAGGGLANRSNYVFQSVTI